MHDEKEIKLLHKLMVGAEGEYRVHEVISGLNRNGQTLDRTNIGQDNKGQDKHQIGRTGQTLDRTHMVRTNMRQDKHRTGQIWTGKTSDRTNIDRKNIDRTNIGQNKHRTRQTRDRKNMRQDKRRTGHK